METLTRLVTESLARHGFDRPLDYRRLHWSQWFRCESPHSLLAVPSKPGVFAIAEEIADLARPGGTTENSPAFQRRGVSQNEEPRPVGTPEINQTMNSANRRLLAVTQFFDADDMAFTLDRMLTRSNPMRTRLASGRYFVRYVVIEEESQRRSISAALNQWIADQSTANQSVANASEKASAIGAHFASSLELTETNAKPSPMSAAAPHLDSGAASNIHCPSPLPSGF
jgi:hypothetical protein